MEKSQEYLLAKGYLRAEKPNLDAYIVVIPDWASKSLLEILKAMAEEANLNVAVFDLDSNVRWLYRTDSVKEYDRVVIYTPDTNDITPFHSGNITDLVSVTHKTKDAWMGKTYLHVIPATMFTPLKEPMEPIEIPASIVFLDAMKEPYWVLNSILEWIDGNIFQGSSFLEMLSEYLKR